ncbi:MAG: methyltransferase domain-containing protein [Ruminiclostridium sp.]|nr:methyltransferase domain-containing protein [Ruminiclostridium sp.]
MTDKFICPVCGHTLLRENNFLKCGKGHCFDISSSGYVNLLTKGGKKGHGDDKKMVKARRDFLSKGYYGHLKEALKNTVKDAIGKNCIILDSGCGEGYYTSGYETALRKTHDVEICGIDVSKEALKLAAKLCHSVSFAVASAYCLPFENESLDIITSVFAPLAKTEFYRTLKSGGYFITVIPMEKHLFGLKKAVYENPYFNKTENTELKGFKLINSTEVKKELFIQNADDIKNLFLMTPYYYKTSAEDQKKLEKINELITETEFLILVYKKI